MIDYPLRFDASVFLDAESIDPSPANISLASGALAEEYEFATVLEPDDAGADGKERIGFGREDGKYQIALGSDRFLFRRSRLDRGDDFENTREFAQRAGEALTALLSAFERNGRRIALLTHGFLNAPDEELEDDRSNQLFNFPEFFDGREHIEWEWKNIVRIDREFGQNTEEVNHSLELGRKSGQLDEQLEFDQLLGTIDLNTLPGESRARFDIDSVASFFREAVSWEREISDSVRAFFQ